MSDVQITVEVARPRGTFPGRVETGYYCVADRHVVLCDEKGRPIGEKRFLDEGADARGIACWMLRRRRANSYSDFDAPISYRRSKYL